MIKEWFTMNSNRLLANDSGRAPSEIVDIIAGNN